MISFKNVDPEALQLVYEHLDNEVLMQRAQAIVRQRAVARAARSMGGQRAQRGKHGQLLARPVANIDTAYYFKRKHEEQEANTARQATDENVWSDPDFIKYELREHPELRPIIDRAGAPMHFSGTLKSESESEGESKGAILAPTVANFKAAKAHRV